VARGWESKSVEAQQAEASEAFTETKPRLGAKEIAVLHKKEGILLSRKRVLQQLQASQNPLHRKMLESALADLNAQLRALD
jgi:hypothetical protein